MKLNHESLENRSLLAAGCAEYYTATQPVAVDLACTLNESFTPSASTDTLVFSVDATGQSFSVQPILKTPITTACEGTGPLSYDCYKGDSFTLSTQGTLKVQGTAVPSSGTRTCSFSYSETVPMPVGSKYVSAAPTVNTALSFRIPYEASATPTAAVLFTTGNPNTEIPTTFLGNNTLSGLSLTGDINVTFKACKDNTEQLVEIATDVSAPLIIKGVNQLEARNVLGDATNATLVVNASASLTAINYAKNLNPSHLNSTLLAAITKAQVDCYFNYNPNNCIIVA